MYTVKYTVFFTPRSSLDSPSHLKLSLAGFLSSDPKTDGSGWGGWLEHDVLELCDQEK